MRSARWPLTGLAALQGYLYETSDIRYTSEKTIDNLLIEEVNFAVGFLKSNIDDQYTHKLGV